MRRGIPTALIFSLALAACGGGQPDPGSARKAVEGTLGGPLAEQIGLVDFRKTDGVTRELMGVKLYSLEFSAAVEFRDDVLYEASERNIQALAPAPTLGNEGAAFGWDAWFNTAVRGRKMAFKGDRLNLVGAVQFERKESGWVVAGVDFKSTLDTTHRAADHGPEALRRAAQAEQERRRQVEEQRQAEWARIAIPKRDSTIAAIRQFASRGSMFRGTYYNLPYEISITSDLTTIDAGGANGLGQALQADAHFKWLAGIEPISPSSSDGQVREQDGKLMISVSVDGENGTPVIRAAASFNVWERNWAEYVTRDKGSTWNGTFFEANERGSFQLQK